MLVFECDQQKSDSNKRKHGIDFIEAQLLWDDPDYLVLPANSEKESRYAVIASHIDNVWAAFCTDRENSIRIISVRRARKEEVKLYEG